MACTAPDLATQVTLATGYTAPALDRFVLLPDCSNAAGWLDAITAPSITAPTLTGTGKSTELAGGQGWLDAILGAAGAIQAPTAAATGTAIPTATLAATEGPDPHIAAPTGTFAAEVLPTATLTAEAGPGITAPTLAGTGDPGERPLYWRPNLEFPVEIDDGPYTPPTLPGSVMLCAEGGFVVGWLGVTTAPAITAPTASAAERPPRDGTDRLWAKLAPPEYAATLHGFERAFIAYVALTTSPADYIIAPQAAMQLDRVIPGDAATSLLAPPPIPPTAAIAADQDLALTEEGGPGYVFTSRRKADKASVTLAACATDAIRQMTLLRTLFADGEPIVYRRSAAHADTLRARRRARAEHAEAQRQATPAATPHSEAHRARRPTTADHAEALRLRRPTGAHHAQGRRARLRYTFDHQQALPIAKAFEDGWHFRGLPIAQRGAQCWTDADVLSPGRWWPFYETPPLNVIIPCYYRPRPLACSVVLGVGYESQPDCPEAESAEPSGIVPVREVYIVLNTVSLVRASDGAPIRARDLSLSINVDSWCWSWSARMPASELPAIEPDGGSPRVLIAEINGVQFNLLAEQISRDRRFGSSWLRVQGRSTAAWLASPYAATEHRTNAAQSTAQQVLEAALTVNGVPIGWEVDWQVTNWVIPAGAWGHAGTYIEAASRIAEAAGAYVQDHPTDDTLRILPRYPAAPWNWATETVDLALPEDACETEGIEWRDAAPYNAVYVVGGTGGRADRVRRAGYAADRPAPTIVDPLATAPEMTRQRGLALLGDTGRQAMITLRLPVLPETGIITPGKLIDYTAEGRTRRGLVRGVSVQQASPDVWQQVRIETHD